MLRYTRAQGPWAIELCVTYNKIGKVYGQNNRAERRKRKERKGKGGTHLALQHGAVAPGASLV